MNFGHVWIAAACMALSAAAAPKSADSACDLNGANVTTAIARLLTKFPEQDLVGSDEFQPIFAGLDVGGITVSGLHKLQQYGPSFSYCVNGTRKIQVDLINKGDVVLTMPWRHCSGSEGVFRLRSSLSRFTIQFDVEVDKDGQDARLSYTGPTSPVTTDTVRLSVAGAGPTINTMAESLAMLFPALILEVWNVHFFYSLTRALHAALD